MSTLKGFIQLIKPLPCLKMPVGLALLGYTASGPHGCAELLVGTGTSTQPRHNMSEELLWLTVHLVRGCGFQELVNT